jgi:hypothetical protein
MRLKNFCLDTQTLFIKTDTANYTRSTLKSLLKALNRSSQTVLGLFLSLILSILGWFPLSQSQPQQTFKTIDIFLVDFKYPLLQGMAEFWFRVAKDGK